MQRRRGFVVVFFIFLIVSIFIYIFLGAKNDNVFFGAIGTVTTPIQKVFVNLSGSVGGIGQDEELVALKRENKKLIIKQAEKVKIEKEISALRDQFKITSINSQKLTPAQIVGRRGIVPGVSVPDTIVIDKGKEHGVVVGQIVMYQDTVLGQIRKITNNLSEVVLLWNSSSSITVETLSTGASGVLKGVGKGEMVIENVVLAEKLSVGDSVVTKGDMDINGVGFPPNLLIGKIGSIDKKQSALFQSAVVESLVDVSKITSVFIISEAL